MVQIDALFRAQILKANSKVIRRNFEGVLLLTLTQMGWETNFKIHHLAHPRPQASTQRPDHRTIKSRKGKNLGMLKCPPSPGLPQAVPLVVEALSTRTR